MSPPSNNDTLCITSPIYEEVVLERARQFTKWGAQRHPGATWAAILTEEVGEFAKAVLEEKRAEMRAEMVQVAAVAVAIIEAMDDGRCH